MSAGKVEAAYYRRGSTRLWPRDSHKTVSGIPGAVHHETGDSPGLGSYATPVQGLLYSAGGPAERTTD